MRSSWPRHFFLPVIILLVLWAGDSLFALTLPDMRMEHLPGGLFTPGEPLVLDVRIEDLAGIIAARCYFRYQPAANYAYVDLAPAGGHDYRATSPAPAESVQSVEYFFLAVNGAHQVVRSPAFTLRKDALARPAPSGAAPGQIEIRTEGATPENFAASLAQSGAVRIAPAGEGERFGLIAGVNFANTLAQADPGLGEGYFGGFQLDANGKPLAVKGFADFSSPAQPAASATTPPTGEDIVGPPIAGKWRGVIFIDYNTQGVFTPGPPGDLTAEITQVGNHVTVVTSLTRVRPRKMDGTMNADGSMLLYDETGDDWSTHWGPATANHMVLADYMFPPTMADHNPPILVVELWRDPPTFLPEVYQLLLLHKAPR